ncbi:MAG: hypothetical protein QOH86_1542 [Sphingomonadales bacterium]|nr:hypothetical protein [Sphingomonadales bacterium]
MVRISCASPARRASMPDGGQGEGAELGLRALRPGPGAGAAMPKTKWGPTLPSAPTVPDWASRAGEGVGASSEAGSGRGLAAPVGPCGSPSKNIAIPLRFPSGPFQKRPESRSVRFPRSAHRFDPLQPPVRNTDRSRSSCRHSFYDNLPPGGRRLSRDDPEKVGSARRPRASSPARPRFRFAPLFLAEEPCSASAAAGRFLFRFRKRPRPATTRNCHLCPIRPSGIRLWITRITGIVLPALRRSESA